MSAPFKVTEDRRSDLERLVRSCMVKDWRTASNLLAGRIEASVFASINANEDRVRPQDRGQLHRLVQLLTSSQAPPVGQIRARSAALAPSIVRQIEARASRLSLHNSALEPVALDFKRWVTTAPGNALAPLLLTLLIDGGQLVPGRKRPGGKQSSPRFEPTIAALPRTIKNIDGFAGGRHERDDLRLLISFLAIDWLQSTGLQPDKGRSDKTPFGALVFMVFSWIGEEDKAAHSLRTYWYPPKPRPKKKPLPNLSQG